MYLSAELIYNCHVLYIYSVGSRPGTWFCIAGLHTWTCSHIQATPRWSLQTLVALCTTHVVSLQQLNYTLQTYFKTKTLGNKIWRSYYTSLKIFKLRLLLFFPNWKSIIFDRCRETFHPSFILIYHNWAAHRQEQHRPVPPPPKGGKFGWDKSRHAGGSAEQK